MDNDYGADDDANDEIQMKMSKIKIYGTTFMVECTFLKDFSKQESQNKIYAPIALKSSPVFSGH